MGDSFHLQIATPEGLLLDAQVAEAEWPAPNGCMGVLPGHAPLMSMLGTGLLTYSATGETVRFNVHIENGFVEVLNDQVRILAEKAKRAEAFD